MTCTLRELHAHLPLPTGCVGEMHTLPFLGTQVPLLAHAAERRCRYFSFMCTYAAPCKLSMHMLEREPCRFMCRDKPEQWSLLVPACAVACPFA